MMKKVLFQTIKNMDPTFNKCLIVDSFEEQPKPTSLEPFKNEISFAHFTPNILSEALDKKGNIPPVYVDVEKYKKLQGVKMEYDVLKEKMPKEEFELAFNKVKNIFNPFEKVGRSGLLKDRRGNVISNIPGKRYGHEFLNRAAIKLANCDAIFKFTGPRVNYLNPVDFKADRDQKVDGFRNYVFGVLAEGPGAMVGYMQKRWPYANGYGVTLRDPSNPNLKWNYSAIRRCSKNRGGFTALWGAPKYGGDETGDLYVNAEAVARELLDKEDGCDVVTGDGGIDVDNAEDYPRQEYLNSRLVLAQIYTALLIIKRENSGKGLSDPAQKKGKDINKGGDLCLKIFDSVTEVTAQMLFLAAICFEEFHLFKPVSSRPANAERYIIGKRCKANIQPVIDLLKTAYDSYRNGMVYNIFDTEKLQGDQKRAWLAFSKWLTGINNQHISQQLETNTNMVAYLQNLDDEEKIAELTRDLPQVNLSKCLIMWNLADNEHSIKAK